MEPNRAPLDRFLRTPQPADLSTLAGIVTRAAIFARAAALALSVG